MSQTSAHHDAQGWPMAFVFVLCNVCDGRGDFVDAKDPLSLTLQTYEYSMNVIDQKYLVTPHSFVFWIELQSQLY